jgi:hypothetical protein
MAKALAQDHLQVAMPRGEEVAARHFYGNILGLVEIPKHLRWRSAGACRFNAAFNSCRSAWSATSSLLRNQIRRSSSMTSMASSVHGAAS